jgi:hypothetical protein
MEVKGDLEREVEEFKKSIVFILCNVETIKRRHRPHCEEE